MNNPAASSGVSNSNEDNVVIPDLIRDPCHLNWMSFAELREPAFAGMTAGAASSGEFTPND